MHIELTAPEARVIGCLIEKQIATPEQYPLSLNALTNACNQKSNRDPVLALDDNAVQAVVDALIKKHQVSEQTGYGSRVPKYEHRFCNTSYGQLKLSAQELAVICELFLRGPQTPGELRSRASRLCSFSDVSEVDGVLTALQQREDGPFVVRLPREPGRRESRFAHLFCGEVAGVAGSESEGESLPARTAEGEDSIPEYLLRIELKERIERMEARVAALEAEVANLKQELGIQERSLSVHPDA